ncbi:hypothetical protein MN608_11329 [Microdochium nivale]|nr:hypothetical protein MN608_11329 [Microdochium nivale]
MHSSQLPGLLPLLLLTGGASAAMISFAIDSDTCGDGFYIGCFGRVAGDCCSLPTGYEGRSVQYILDTPAANVLGQAFSGKACVTETLVGEQASPTGDIDLFCLSPPSALVSSAHFVEVEVDAEATPASSRKSNKTRGVKECRSPDHLVFPGGARTDITGLADREYKEM